MLSGTFLPVSASALLVAAPRSQTGSVAREIGLSRPFSVAPWQEALVIHPRRVLRAPRASPDYGDGFQPFPEGTQNHVKHQAGQPTFRRFLDSEASGSIVLMARAALAILTANSPLARPIPTRCTPVSDR